MARWKRVLRGVIGTGLGFAAGAGLVMATLAGVFLILRRGEGWEEMAITVAGSMVWGFLIGVVFAGVTAVVARGRALESLSLPRFGALGMAAGLLLYGLLALNAWDAWSVSAAVTNAVVFVVLGGGAATGSLVLARRAGAGPPASGGREIGEGRS